MSSIVLFSHPSGNHPDSPAGSSDIAPGTRVNPEDVVCNALVAPNGAMYFAEDFGHKECAIALGLDGVEDAMTRGYIHVAVKYNDISHYNRVTASQIRTLQDMYWTAMMAPTQTYRTRNYMNAFRAFAAAEGITLDD